MAQCARQGGGSSGLAINEADDGNDGRVVLNGPFEAQGIVIGTTSPPGVFTACFGATFVDGAAAGFRMEKLAGHTEKRIFGAFQDARSVGDFGVFARGFFDGNSKMSGEAFDVEIGDFNALVDGATKCNAFCAIVLKT
jgi:hypothetical protein